MYRILLFVFLFLDFTHADSTQLLETKYLIDQNHSVTIEEIGRYKKDFSLLSKENSSLGLTQDTVWISVKADNPSAHEKKYVVEFLFLWHDHIEAYYLSEGKVTDHYSTGHLKRFDTRPMDTGNFVFPYSLKAGETKELFFKLNSQNTMDLEMQILSVEAYYDGLSTLNMFLGFYYGAVLIMLIYNLVLYFMIRDGVYLDYVLFHFVFLLLSVMMNGILFQYFYPQFPIVNKYLPIPVLLALNYFALKFEITFLSLKTMTPKLVKYIQILMGLLIVTGVLSLFMPTLAMARVSVSLSMFSFVLVYAVSFYMLFKFKTVASKFFVFAWSFIVISALLDLLQSLGVLPSSTGIFFRAQFGSLIELALFAFALAYRYNSLFVKLGSTETELRFVNAKLEKKVRARTQNLNEKNMQLSLEVNNKNVLFRELYHRVKNNLQIISSLLSLQSKRIEDPHAQSLMDETNQRIKAMAMIHEKLYQTGDFSYVNMQDYTLDLVSELGQSFHNERLRFKISCEEIKLPLETAVPMGLIINEIVTNAIKYAFDESQTEQLITVNMYTTEKEMLVLEIFDNGKGVDLTVMREGFGSKLIQSLANYQLKADIHAYNDDGLHYKIIFSKEVL